MSRSGPSAAKMENASNSTSLTISTDGLTVENKGDLIVTAKCPIKLKSGKWYYEAKLQANSNLVVGWVNSNWAPTASAIGEDAHSWAYDAARQKKWHINSEWYGEYCYSGDTIGVSIDLDERKINFFRNGRNMGAAYENIDVGSEGVYPAASINARQKILFNFGKIAWSYPPPSEEFKGLHCFLTEQELKDLDTLYVKYRDIGISLSESGDTGENIKSQGFLQYGKDLGVIEDSDPGLLILSWKLDAKNQWEFSKEEFLSGWTGYGAASTDNMKQKLDSWREELNTKDDQFRKFYFWLFDYLKEEEKKTTLLAEECFMVWGMIGMDKRWPLWGKWNEFLVEAKTQALPRDTWRQLFEFMLQYPKDLDSYDECSSWPLLFDGFVVFVKTGEVPDL